jgi:ubiquinone/menaquinone biosynthesis C-methylase UbiE
MHASHRSIPAPTFQPAWDTRGRIKTTRVLDGRLILRGAVATPHDEPAQHFRVFFDQTWIGDFEASRGQSSPGAGTADCPFEIIVSGDQLEDRLRGTLVTVLPLAGERSGSRMLAIPRPAVPPPDERAFCAAFGEVASRRGSALINGWWSRSPDYLSCFVDRAGLAPGERVCEIGCGLGRMANALGHYLGSSGSYRGLDVREQPVRWAQQYVGGRFPQFQFDWMNLRNAAYNPGGLTAADAARLPWGDGSFDFVFLTSVFTHLLPVEVRRYLSEIRRILRPGGRCVCSWYLLNETALQSMRTRSSAYQFSHQVECGRSQTSVAEELIAFDESMVMQWIGESRMEALNVFPGMWTGRSGCVGFQDILVLKAI